LAGLFGGRAGIGHGVTPSIKNKGRHYDMGAHAH
jgi:hypothetical protein